MCTVMSTVMCTVMCTVIQVLCVLCRVCRKWTDTWRQWLTDNSIMEHISVWEADNSSANKESLCSSRNPRVRHRVHKSGRCVRLTTLTTSWAIVTLSGNLNFLEHSGNLGPVIGLIYLLRVIIWPCFQFSWNLDIYWNRLMFNYDVLIYMSGNK